MWKQMNNCFIVVFIDRHRQQLVGIGKARRKLVEPRYNLFQASSLLPQALGALRIIPDVRLLELALNFGQSLRLRLIVKDTPSTHWCVRSGQLSIA